MQPADLATWPLAAPAASDTGDLATWIGVLVALVVGIGGVVVGVIGLLIARGAKAEAARANEVAAEANEVSKKANDLAAAALQSSDVWWELQWVPLDTGKAILVNRGHDTATNVRGHLQVDEATIDFGPVPKVEGGDEMAFVFSDVKVLLAVEESREHLQYEEGGRKLVPLKMGYASSHAATHTVSWRVSWETPLGHTFHDKQTFLDQPLIPRSKQTGS